MSETAPENTLEASIGLQLKSIRTTLGMTMSDLSKAASVSVGMLSKIENGQISPSLSTLQALAEAPEQDGVFALCLADVLAVPGMREPLLEVLRGPDLPASAQEAFAAMQES